jgi:hypothetical protein
MSASGTERIYVETQHRKTDGGLETGISRTWYLAEGNHKQLAPVDAAMI